MSVLDRRQFISGISWSSPIVIGSATISAYAASPSCINNYWRWRKIKTSAIGHGFDESSYNRYTGQKLSPNGFTSRESIKSLTVTSRGTLLPSWGDARLNSDSFGTTPVILDEISPDGKKLDSFPIGSEEIKNINIIDNVAYAQMIDPSDRDMTKAFTNRGWDPKHKTGYYTDNGTGNWEYIPLEDPNGKPYIAEHVIGIVGTPIKGVVGVLFHSHNDTYHNLKYEQSVLLVGNKQVGFRVVTTDNNQHGIEYSLGNIEAEALYHAPEIIHHVPNELSEYKTVVFQKSNKPYNSDNTHNDEPSDKKAWDSTVLLSIIEEEKQSYIDATTYSFLLPNDKICSINLYGEPRIKVTEGSSSETKFSAPTLEPHRNYAAGFWIDATKRYLTVAYSQAPGVICVIDKVKGIASIINIKPHDPLYTELEKCSIGEGLSRRMNQAVLVEDTLFIGQNDGHILAIGDVFNNHCSIFDLTS